MGLHLLNVAQLFRRRKYDRVLGGQAGGEDEAQLEATSNVHQVNYLNRNNSAHARSQETAPSTAGHAKLGIWGFKMRPKLRTPKRSSKPAVGHAASSSSSVPAAMPQAAVQNFLQGPAQEGEDQAYQQQCRDLLRKLSARGNRFV